MKKKILFIRLENTLVTLNDTPTGFRFAPGAISSLSRMAAELEYEFVLLAGNNNGSAPENALLQVKEQALDVFYSENIRFTETLFSGSKPVTDLFARYLYGAYDIKNSWFITANPADVETAAALNCPVFLFAEGKNTGAINCVPNWTTLVKQLSSVPRTATVTRKTNETEISVYLNLDGSGIANINTGIGFFDHMLHQLSRHGNLDLGIQVTGDLHIDEHHTIEDTAITLGEAFYQALGMKKGIERYGFLLPMDDCIAQVAIDFGGRAWLEWEVQFQREKIGDVPTEMFFHFFKSFTDLARCNLNIKAAGENEHHKIESVFKAFAKAVKMAVAQTGEGIPSTKGVL